MFFINLLLIDFAICLGYIILSYIFKIKLNTLIIMVLVCIGNVIYLRWGGGGIQHILPATIVGVLAGGISGFVFMVLYYMFEDKVLKRFDWERPLCVGPEQCGKCGSTRIHETVFFGSSYDHVITQHHCNKCGFSWTYSED